MIYAFLRLWVVPLAFIGWILYQLFKKKKTWAEIQPDAMVIFIFLGIWAFIYFEFIK